MGFDMAWLPPRAVSRQRDDFLATGATPDGQPPAAIRHRLIKQHGDEVPIHAATRADELLDAGDIVGTAAFPFRQADGSPSRPPVASASSASRPAAIRCRSSSRARASADTPLPCLAHEDMVIEVEAIAAIAAIAMAP
jgi:hypothetical protein